MKRVITVFLITAIFVSVFYSAGSCDSKIYNLKRSRLYKALPSQVLRRLSLPAGYHEGLFCDGEDILVANGPKGNIWVVDSSSGSVTSELMPPGGFTESVIRGPDDGIFVTDWNEKKLYRARIENNKIIPESGISFGPEYPAGVVWNGAKFFVITWHRGLTGTRFYLVEIDEKLNVIRKSLIHGIQEPAHLAWDGRDLWITSWFNKAVYKVDIDKYEIAGFFVSPVARTTGIAWDGKNFWLTGTYSDLYKIEAPRS